ncbi:hypothetical protein Vafri_22316 [Volvox africanus]|uniref:Peptidase A2 domain-containing protein n=1 Tax=Volvox africanus TaxID=51714 RepID=A0A8J4FB69_9CHLO|nr:hypothetical protein Vafri_22316 [Volvox africanus]GIL68988.1 hypothetical protein Vafri_22316 [Volvox africanus]GIL68992.1 hypothetical protein Vafri_22316 [Volvox africanus]
MLLTFGTNLLHPILMVLPYVPNQSWAHYCRPQRRLRQVTVFWWFRSTSVGRSLNTLIDTDASDDFISSAEVNALGLPPQSSEWSQVTLVDGGKHPILGRVTRSLSVGPLRITTQPYLLQELTEAATYILGSWTLRQYGASIDMESATLRLCKGTLSCKVPFVLFASVGPEGGRSEVEPVVNFAVAVMQKRTEPKPVGCKEAD